MVQFSFWQPYCFGAISIGTCAPGQLKDGKEVFLADL
jgi:hypothetical protein